MVMFACEIWSAKSPTYQSLLASRVVGTFFGACTEALGAVVVNVRVGLNNDQIPANVVSGHLLSPRARCKDGGVYNRPILR